MLLPVAYRLLTWPLLKQHSQMRLYLKQTEHFTLLQKNSPKKSLFTTQFLSVISLATAVDVTKKTVEQCCWQRSTNRFGIWPAVVVTGRCGKGVHSWEGSCPHQTACAVLMVQRGGLNPCRDPPSSPPVTTCSGSDSALPSFSACAELQTLVPFLCRGRISSLTDKYFFRKKMLFL